MVREILAVTRRLRQRILGGSTASQLSMWRSVDPTEQVIDALPLSYRYVEFQPRVNQQWISLINESGEFRGLGIWTDDTLQSAIMSQAVPGGVVLVGKGNSIVACLSLCNAQNEERSGVLMYVLVSESHRGHGLGSLMIQRSLRICQLNGITRLRLRTDDHRLDAIKLYLRNRFVPDVQGDRRLQARWNSILKKVQ